MGAGFSNNNNSKETVVISGSKIKIISTNSARFYSYTNGRIITDSDDMYGGNHFQMREQAGTGVDPIYEWEHMGVPLPKDTAISGLMFGARANNNEITDFELIVVERKPNTSLGWISGVDNDNEMQETVIYRDMYKNSVNKNGVQFSGAMNDFHMANINLDYVTSDECMLSIYIKPIENNTRTRYIYSTWTFYEKI